MLQQYVSYNFFLMIDLSQVAHNIKYVSSFKDLISNSFNNDVNAMCWKRDLIGDFSEIVKKLKLDDNMAVINEEKLCELKLSEDGQLAREVILNDLKALKAHGASPILNLIKYYERDDTHPFFATDVYSFHVDRSPIPTDTFLCTYYGESSEILPNSQGIQKVLIPELREKLKTLYNGAEEGFELFLKENFFDLHYQPKAFAQPISLALGNLWKLAVDYPESNTLPCIHRAPKEKQGEHRLLLIC